MAGGGGGAVLGAMARTAELSSRGTEKRLQEVTTISSGGDVQILTVGLTQKIKGGNVCRCI